MVRATPIQEIWSAEYLVRLERRIWWQVMDFQYRANPELVTLDQVVASHGVIDSVDLDSIHQREMVTKHDLMARLEEFAALSGHNRIHLGMTSADIVENTFLIRQLRSVVALGPRTVMAASLPPFRGIRGPIGSDVDQIALIGLKNAQQLSKHVAHEFGFDEVINSVAQCMPRSFDLRLANSLFPLIEDEAGRAIASGCLTMLAEQNFWLEGDVASSCVRRHAWPLLFSVLEGTYLKEREHYA